MALERTQIALILNQANRPLSALEIAKKVGLNVRAVRRILLGFFKRGVATREYKDTCRLSGRSNVWFYWSGNIYDY